MAAARITSILAIATAALSLSCSRVGMADDGTSVSWSRTNGGKLLHPVELPASGDGYVIFARWASVASTTAPTRWCRSPSTSVVVAADGG